MVTFNSNDFNISKIERLARISKLKTHYDYRIYGLKDEDKNPLVLIEFNNEMFPGEITNFHRNTLSKFFLTNGIYLKFSDIDEEKKKTFYIGLRYDLRKDVTISTNIVQTVVYFLDGKIELNTSYKVVPGVPKIYSRGKR